MSKNTSTSNIPHFYYSVLNSTTKNDFKCRFEDFLAIFRDHFQHRFCLNVWAEIVHKRLNGLFILPNRMSIINIWNFSVMICLFVLRETSNYRQVFYIMVYRHIIVWKSEIFLTKYREYVELDDSKSSAVIFLGVFKKPNTYINIKYRWIG